MASNSVKPLIFFDTDHGFNLAFDGAPGRAFDAARFRGDDTDWLLWHRRGRPSSYRYQFRWADAPAAPSLQPLSFASTMAEPIEIEVESLVPVATHDAFIGMDYQNGCRPDAHGLRVELTADVARVEMLATAPPCDRVQMWFYADIPPGVVAGLGADRLAARRVGPCDELGPIVRPVTAQGTVYIDFIASLEMAPRSAQSTATPEDGPPNGARRLSLDRLTMRCFPGTE